MEIEVVLRFDPHDPQERAEAAAIVAGETERLRGVLRELLDMLNMIYAGTWPDCSATDAVGARAADQVAGWLTQRLAEEGLILRLGEGWDDQ